MSGRVNGRVNGRVASDVPAALPHSPIEHLECLEIALKSPLSAPYPPDLSLKVSIVRPREDECRKYRENRFLETNRETADENSFATNRKKFCQVRL